MGIDLSCCQSRDKELRPNDQDENNYDDAVHAEEYATVNTIEDDFEENEDDLPIVEGINKAV